MFKVPGNWFLLPFLKQIRVINDSLEDTINAEVPLTSIGRDDDHIAAVLLRILHRNIDRSARRNTNQDTFSPRKLPDHSDGVIVGGGLDMVDNGFVEHFGDEVGTNTLDFVGSSFPSTNERWVSWLDKNGLDVCKDGFEHRSTAGNGATSAATGNEELGLDVELAALDDELRGGAEAVRLRVARVLELADEDGTRGRRDYLLGFVDSTSNTLSWLSFDKFSTVSCDELLALFGHRWRHRDLQLYTHRRAYHGQANTGITRAGLDKHGIRFDLPALLHVLHHLQGYAVLNWVTSVLAFHF